MNCRKLRRQATSGLLVAVFLAGCRTPAVVPKVSLQPPTSPASTCSAEESSPTIGCACSWAGRRLQASAASTAKPTVFAEGGTSCLVETSDGTLFFYYGQ
jgi:hypothetical protein